MPNGGETARTSESARSAEPVAPLSLVEDGAREHDRPAQRGIGARISAHVATWRSVYLAFALSRVLVLVAGFGAELLMRVRGVDAATWRPFAFAETYPHYADVVLNGYTLQNAFDHPLLPTLLAAFGAIGVPLALSAFVISNACFLAGLVGITVLGERYVGAAATRRAAVYLAFMPFAYWFTIASTESLMLALLAGSALLALRATPRAWLGAGTLAALAALTRPPGALVALLLLCIAIGQLRNRALTRRGIAAALSAGAMVPAALLAFFAYLGARTGDPIASLHAQEQFNRHTSLLGPVRALESGVKNTLAGSPGQAIELVATLGAAAMLVWFLSSAAGRRWEVRGWALYGAASLLLPLATSVLWQMPRFALLVPPIFWMLGRLGERRALHYALLVCLPLALVVKTATAVIGVTG